jgi:hypothetical protein
MLIIKSMRTGLILGFAHTQAVAMHMAAHNGWDSWFIESDETPRFPRGVENKTGETDAEKEGGDQ